MEVGKTLAKVAGRQNGQPAPKRHRQDCDPNDLCHFFGEGHPCKVRWQEPEVPTKTVLPSKANEATPREDGQKPRPAVAVKLNQEIVHTHTNNTTTTTTTTQMLASRCQLQSGRHNSRRHSFPHFSSSYPSSSSPTIQQNTNSILPYSTFNVSQQIMTQV